ncbi:hypothetical protein [Pseudoalteromonas sp. S558]|uniref:hypothetical protein n=1 Tax=Pseudoalteromonas sp. S558 TaxID=2066515 RepID=UPI00110A6E13|nr:hypothetical protein [Pseudoalteromonas sp. S558]
MLYFYQAACEIDQEIKENLINKLKDNFHRHPRTGYVDEVIKALPQKKFTDVINALTLLDERFQQHLHQIGNADEQSLWMHELLLEVDTHIGAFGLDPQQTGNLLRYTLRGMVYHHIVEHGEYMLPQLYSEPLAYIHRTTMEHTVFQYALPQQCYGLSHDQLTHWLCELIRIYKQAVLACCLLLKDQQVDLLCADLQCFNSAHYESFLRVGKDLDCINMVELKGTIKRLTQYSDLYWNLGALYGLRAFICHLNIHYCDILPHVNLSGDNPITSLIEAEISNKETLAAAYNSAQQLLNKLNHATKKNC